MINKDKLRGAIRAKGFTLKTLCETVGISVSSFIRKEKHDSFGIDEVSKIVLALGLTRDEAVDIFLASI